MSESGVVVEIEQLAHAEGIPLPTYATKQSAGMDLRAAVEHSVVIDPGRWIAVPIGIKIALPDGYEAQVRARSGLAAKFGIGVPNGPGTIDSDYRGEVKVLLINWSDQPFSVRRGDRIAQLVVAPVSRAQLVKVQSVDATERGEGGFGHTGLD